MDCKKTIDDMWSEIYERHYDDSGRICERIAENAERLAGRKAPRKRGNVFAAAASLLTAAALTVSAGAAANWDIASMFVRQNAKARELPLTWFQREFREYYADESFSVNGASSESEYEILQSISAEVDRKFDIGGHTVHIFGYAYDGNLLDVLYEVAFDGEMPEGTPTFSTMILSVPDDRYDPGASEYDMLCDPGKYRARFDIRIPEDTGTVRLYIVDEAEREKVYAEGMGYKSENYVDITLDRNNPYSYSTNCEVRIGDGFTVTNLSISPFLLRLEGTSVESVRAVRTPILAVFRDGTVIDLHRSGSGACKHEFYSHYFTKGILLDAREIKELRIGDAVIPVSG